jgi:hypothetical protein
LLQFFAKKSLKNRIIIHRPPSSERAVPLPGAAVRAVAAGGRGRILEGVPVDRRSPTGFDTKSAGKVSKLINVVLIFMTTPEAGPDWGEKPGIF